MAEENRRASGSHRNFEGAIAKVLYEYVTQPERRGEFFLYKLQEVRVGREKDDNNDIGLGSNSVSERHCAFFTVAASKSWLICVRDRRSERGTHIHTKSGDKVCVGSADLVLPGRIVHDGDIVQVGNWVFGVEILAPLGEDSQLTQCQRMELDLLVDRYVVTNIVLGQGTQGSARVAYDARTKEQLVVKMTDKEQLARVWGEAGAFGIVKGVKKEADFLSKLDHPNIVSLRASFESPHQVYLFMEMGVGGDLGGFLRLKPILQPWEVQWILREILQGLNYLHGFGVAHRDLKPANILLCSAGKPGHRIAIADFGHAAVFRNQSLREKHVGTRGYTSPEVVSQSHDQEGSSDMWSVAVIACELSTRLQEKLWEKRITGPVFDWLSRAKDQVTITTWLGGAYTARPSPFGAVFLGFVQSLLRLDPAQRLTAAEALHHPLLSEQEPTMAAYEERRNATWATRATLLEAMDDLPDVLAEDRAPRPRVVVAAPTDPGPVAGRARPRPRPRPAPLDLNRPRPGISVVERLRWETGDGYYSPRQT